MTSIRELGAEQFQEEVSYHPRPSNEFAQLALTQARPLNSPILVPREAIELLPSRHVIAEFGYFHRSLSLAQPLYLASAIPFLFLCRSPVHNFHNPHKSIGTETFSAQVQQDSYFLGFSYSFWWRLKMPPTAARP
ncbi:hypothetical protein GJ744_003017 [Endocarpon pusillum]|uniref:Uncharacterized protein n=1 Tax=Endocarpon pusillum TaxID=364733 RepID=A0A8H7DZK5_9EURO|nr:hypothetical protein GJ744_003017 [Endocarpon pusillum]